MFGLKEWISTIAILIFVALPWVAIGLSVVFPWITSVPGIGGVISQSILYTYLLIPLGVLIYGLVNWGFHWRSLIIIVGIILVFEAILYGSGGLGGLI